MAPQDPAKAPVPAMKLQLGQTCPSTPGPPPEPKCEDLNSTVFHASELFTCLSSLPYPVISRFLLQGFL